MIGSNKIIPPWAFKNTAELAAQLSMYPDSRTMFWVFAYHDIALCDGVLIGIAPDKQLKRIIQTVS
jgi:hypothetical protein